MALQSDTSAMPKISDDTAVYEKLEGYDWARDTEFQSGLQAILGSTKDTLRIEHLKLRARCFYFSRKNSIRIDFNQYLAWHTSKYPPHAVCAPASEPSETLAKANVERRASVAQQHSNVPNPVEPPAPYPTSFEQIVELISTGQPVPGIKDVPDTVLEGQASRTTAARREKPWEKNNAVQVNSDTETQISEQT